MSVIPEDLERAERANLAKLEAKPLLRTRNGFARADRKVTLDMASRLVAKGVARIEGGKLVPTGEGRNVLAVLDQRRAGR